MRRPTIARAFSLSFLLLQLACSNKEAALSGQTAASNTEAEKPAEPEPIYEGKGDDESGDLSAEALTPTPIGGAYLVCNPIPEGAECRAFDYQNQPYDMQADRAFILTGKPVLWSSIEFVRTNVGTWTVKVPADVSSFGIAFLDRIDQHLADWIVKEDSAPQNLALDGSFESLEATGIDYQAMLPPEGYPWKVLKSDSAINLCTLAYLEVQTIASGQPPIDGNQWIELNSSCLDPNPVPPLIYNITVSQKIKVEVGHSYLILVNHRSRAPGSFDVFFGASKLASLFSGDSSWQQLSFVRKADSTEAEIAITGRGESDGGGGTLIDNIRIYDLGTGPIK